MTDPVKEQLSACLDGALPADELDMLLKRVQRDPLLRESMGAYAFVGEALRSQHAVRASAGFAARVSAAVAAQSASSQSTPTPAAARSHSGQRIQEVAFRWLKPATGIAIAAGVATVAVLVMQPTAMRPELVAINSPVNSSINNDEAASGARLAPPGADSYTVPTNTGTNSTASFIPAARLTNYVVAHSEYSSPLGRRTVLSGVLSDDDSGMNDVGAPDESLNTLAPQP